MADDPKEPDLPLAADAHCAICSRWIRSDDPTLWTVLIREDGTAEPIHVECIAGKAENWELRGGTLKFNVEGLEAKC